MASYFLVPLGTLEDWSKLPEPRLRRLRRRRSVIGAVALAVAVAGALLIGSSAFDAPAELALWAITVAAIMQVGSSVLIVVRVHRQLRAIEYERGIPEHRGSTWPT